MNKNASATIEFRKDDEGILKEKGKEISAHNITYLSLGNLMKINGVDIYPNKKIMIDLFFFEVEATDAAYISIHEHEDNPDLLRDFPVPVYPNKLSDRFKITAKEGRDIHFKLFIEKDKAGKLPDILHMALLLSEV